MVANVDVACHRLRSYVEARAGVAVVVTLSLLVGGVDAQARGRDDSERVTRLRALDELGRDTAELDDVIEQLSATPVEALARASALEFGQSLDHARDLFLVGDYANVGIILYGLVEDGAHRTHPGYNEAVYYLAQSLYETRQFEAAEVYFARLAETKDPSYSDQAVAKLIAIADRSRDWEQIDGRVAGLASEGPLAPEVSYLYMKSLLRRDRPKEAKALLASVPQNDALWAKARYLAAVADVELGRLEEARQGFDEVRGLPQVFDDIEKVQELAAINVGRLYLEAGELSKAIDAYQDVERSSELFDRALFEIAWTFVGRAAQAQDDESKKTEFAKATRALEILLLGERESPIMPEARLLLANIRLRVARFADATEVFNDVIERYDAVERKLGNLIADKSNPKVFYEELVQGRRMGSVSLPSLALSWAENGRGLREARSIVDDLSDSDEWLDESGQLVETLLGALTSDQRTAFFPRLRDVQVRNLGAKNQLFSLRRRLVGIIRSAVLDSLETNQRLELEELAARRLRLTPAYQRLPQGGDQYRSQATVMRRDMRDLLRQVHVVEIALAGRRRELAELTRLVDEQGEKLESAEVATLQATIVDEARVVDQLSDVSKGLSDEIERKRELIADTMEREAAAGDIRTRYEEVVEREQEILEAALLRLGDSALTQRVDELRSRFSRFEADLKSFNGRLTLVVGKKSEQILAAVRAQQKVLQELNQDSVATRRATQDIVSQAAVDSIAAVEARLEDIVLRADVGLLDVTWAEKEALAQEITREVSEQRRELERFDVEFREVLSED